MTTLRRQVGQLLLVGLGGAALEPIERAWLRLLQPAGFILFRRNIEQAAQVTELLRQATDAAASSAEQVPAMRALDLEGGPVDRLRDLLAPMPSPAAVAAAHDPRVAERHGRLIGRATRLLGFNTTFAPVLDLGLPEALPVLRTRVAAATPEAVSAYAAPFLGGLRVERVLGCGKHFPGLGGGTLDSHLATPRIERPWDRLWEEDIAPYRDLLLQLPIIMVAHAIYPEVKQGGESPASVSHFWITKILRQKMGFAGLILSDDMEMGGLLTQRGMEEAAVEAIAAGCDLIEICKDPALVLRAYEALLSEAENSPAFRKLVQRAATRVVEHKQRLLPAILPRNATAEQIARLRKDILLFTSELEAKARQPLPVSRSVAL